MVVAAVTFKYASSSRDDCKTRCTIQVSNTGIMSTFSLLMVIGGEIIQALVRTSTVNTAPPPMLSPAPVLGIYATNAHPLCRHRYQPSRRRQFRQDMESRHQYGRRTRPQLRAGRDDPSYNVAEARDALDGSSPNARYHYAVPFAQMVFGCDSRSCSSMPCIEQDVLGHNILRDRGEHRALVQMGRSLMAHDLGNKFFSV